MRLINDDTTLIESILAGFLRSLSSALEADIRSAFWLSNPPLICPGGEIIRSLSSSPSDELKKAWSKLIESSDVYRLVPEASENRITITPALTALAIAAYNFLKIDSQADQDRECEQTKSSGFDYNLKLCPTIVSATNLVEGIIYDSLIDPCCKIWRKKSPKTEMENSFLVALLCINPFSELKNIDLGLPLALKSLAGSYLNHIEESHEHPSPSDAEKICDNKHQQWWLQTEEFILNPQLIRVLRDQWLNLPENSLSSIGLGIFLEELRRRGKKIFRTQILEFFEAYDYIQRHQTQTQGGSETPYKLSYQRLTIIKHMLESKNRELNRKGNEYFLKFRALLEIIAEEQSIPGEFRHLSREFCLQKLAPLAALATVIGGERATMVPSFGEIQFSDQPEIRK